MVTGDQGDILDRLKALAPRAWFDSDISSIRDAVFSGLAAAHAIIYGMIAFVRRQTRIRTATEGFLDLIAADFFGPSSGQRQQLRDSGLAPRFHGDSVTRRQNQSDANFRNVIQINLFRERATRLSVERMLQGLTGRTPEIIEPMQPNDCGGYGASNVGYGVAGAYGSMSLSFQAFVTAHRPTGSGIPNVSGYCVSTGGYGTASQAEYASMGMIAGQVTDADIFAAVDSVRPVGTILWTRIGN